MSRGVASRVESCGDELTLQRLGGGGGESRRGVASRVESCGDELTLERWGGGVEEGWPPGSRAVVMSSHFRGWGGGGGGGESRRGVASRVEICGDELTLHRWGGGRE